MTIQADCSIGLKAETTYGTGVTVDRFLEFTSETLDFDRKFVQGNDLRPGSRLARSSRRVMTQDGGKGDIELEVPTRGLGTFLNALMGVGTSTLVSTGLYQQLFTLIHNDYLPSMTVQKGVPRLGANVVDAYTAVGAIAESFELSIATSDILKLKSTWTAKQILTTTSYATPSYAAGAGLFSFVGAGITIGGTPTVPTATTLSSGGTVAADVTDFSLQVDQKIDGGGYNMGGSGLRTRPPAVGIAEVKGKVTVEYDSTVLRDALANQTPLGLVATFQGQTAISAGQYPTLQIVCPDIRFEGELPKSNGGDVITQSMDFTVLDGQVAAEPLYIVVRTADTAL